jgi:outer membrane protein insertion porin family
MQRFYSVLVLIFLCFGLTPQVLQAQEDNTPVADYGKSKEYEIGSVKVKGAQFSDENAIISIAGLKVGDKVRIPGPEIQKAIKSLWKIKLFTDVQIFKERTLGDVIFLEIVVKERARYSRHSFKTVKKNAHEELNKIVDRRLIKGSIVSENTKIEVKNDLEKHFRDKGFLDTEVNIQELPDEATTNSVRFVFDVNKKKKVKIQDITFSGNANATPRKLWKQLEKTKRKYKIFSGSKFLAKEYEEDKKKMLKYYNKIGFRDAKIKSDSIWREKDGDVRIHIALDEGKRYYFHNIVWKGNSIYDTETLERVLGIKKGDIYNTELLDNRLKFSQDGRDVSTLYMDNGYLFFNVDPTEVSIDKDSIDVEMRIFEGPQATIDRVVVKGNDRTHDHVIRRELRTKPGQKFSRSDIIRSQREIVSLGYFNAEKLGINTPVNPTRGTVDIEYSVEEKPSDQLELSAGWGGGYAGQKASLIGTLGVSFNNFSVRNITKRETWSPLPQGDGQKFSVRWQTNAKAYQSLNMSFTEPWLGGKRPISFSSVLYRTGLNYGYYYGTPNSNKYTTTGMTLSLGSRLKIPDDNFISTTAIDLKRQNLTNFTSGGFLITNGQYNNFSIKQTFSRSSVSDPLFPKSGSNLTFIAQFTPPYSKFRSDTTNYATWNTEKRFKWLEYHKWRFNAEWYATIVGNLVVKASTKIGVLGSYNKAIGLSPFERFTVGGNGLSNYQNQIIGNDLISTRGYKSPSEQPGDFPGSGTSGGGVFSKYDLELRYPISLNPQSTIYVLAFAEGVNAWKGLRDYNPFDVKRSAGLGLRVFLPMFGMLGADWGVGFDKPYITTSPVKLKDLSTFNIILGFEPD